MIDRIAAIVLGALGLRLIIGLASAIKTIALVKTIASSDRPLRPSFDVMAFMLARGCQVFPVNPNPALTEIQGQRAHPSLAAIDQPIDMVQVFRRSEALYEVAEDAIAIKAKILWAQLGVIDEAAAELAQSAGLSVVMDRCPKIELARV